MEDTTEETEETEQALALTPVDSDELNTTAEFRGNKEDEEDLLLTAQRYLNIYHQIHIFKEFRKKQFDKELLETTLEIRKVIALLPGGRILLEHIAELNEAAKIKDVALERILASLAKKSHLSDEEMSSIGPSTAAPMLVAPSNPSNTASAPFELGQDFTNALTDSFKAYSQNIKDLSDNIKQMVNTGNQTSASGSTEINDDLKNALTDSFKAYAQNIQDLSASIKQISTHNADFSAANKTEYNSELTKDLTDSFKTYAANIQELSASIRQMAANNNPTINNATEQALPELASSIAELSANIHKISAEPHPALTYNTDQALPELAGSIAELSANIQKFSEFNSSLHQKTETEAIPQFTTSIAELLKENAQQQMNVLKTFGETISKTIADSQKDLINSLKKMPQESMIIGKFMQVPTQSKQQVENNTTEAFIINEEPTYSSNVSDKPQLPTNQFQNKSQNQPQSNNKNQKSENKNKVQNTNQEKIEKSAKNKPNKPAKVVLTEPYVSTTNHKTEDITTEPEIKHSIVSKDNTDVITDSQEDVDIDDILAQISPQEDEPQIETASSAEQFNDNVSQHENSSFDNAMSKIKNALNSDEKISLDDFDVSPVSLNNDEPYEPEFSSAESAQQSIEDALTGAFDDFSASENSTSDYYDNNNDDNGEADNVANNSEDWDYEYVDEDGNPVEPTDNAEDWGYEYVDEDGNPIDSSADEDWEYEYVDEDGNPVDSSADEDWEYEYVDEDGNPIDSAEDNTATTENKNNSKDSKHRKKE